MTSHQSLLSANLNSDLSHNHTLSSQNFISDLFKAYIWLNRVFIFAINVFYHNAQFWFLRLSTENHDCMKVICVCVIGVMMMSRWKLVSSHIQMPSFHIKHPFKRCISLNSVHKMRAMCGVYMHQQKYDVILA